MGCALFFLHQIHKKTISFSIQQNHLTCCRIFEGLEDDDIIEITDDDICTNIVDHSSGSEGDIDCM